MTLEEISQLKELTKSVDQINTNVALLLDRDRRRDQQYDDHEKRLRSVERWKYAIPVSMILVIVAYISGRVG